MHALSHSRGCRGGHRPRRRCRAAWPLALALVLRPAAAGAAAYAASAAAPDLPTGALTAPIPAPDLRGARWTLAPVRFAGRTAIDTRWLRLEDGTRISQAVISSDLDLDSYVWQPWFVQLRAGFGVLAARDRVQARAAAPAGGTSTALTGRLGLAVFPASRFPFDVRFDVADSRSGGEALGGDYRSQRLGVSQSYRPADGSDLYTVTYDRSRLASDRWGTDTVQAFNALALRYLGRHTLELGGGFTRNQRSDSGDTSSLASVRARHSYQPDSALHVETLASWNDTQLHAGGFEFESDLRQLSSFATWRPREGDWLYRPDAPLYLTGSARILVADIGSGGASGGGAAQRANTLNATVGYSQDLGRAWRVAAAVAGTMVNASGAERSRSTIGNAGITYTPEALRLGSWRYAPIASVTAGASHSSSVGQRYLLGGQFVHGLSRGIAWDGGQSLSVNLTQSLAVLRETTTDEVTRSLAHSVGLYWQGASDGRRYRFASLSLSDARNRDTVRGSFQLVNLQLSQRQQATRYSSWSGDITLQGTRSSTTLVDPFASVLRERSSGWRHYYSGTLSYENQRVWSVPRLRFTLLLGINSQQFESRLLGDVDAPRERITRSVEARLDHAIGRLESRLSTRLARVDGRTVSGIFLHVQRSY